MTGRDTACFNIVSYDSYKNIPLSYTNSNDTESTSSLLKVFFSCSVVLDKRTNKIVFHHHVVNYAIGSILSAKNILAIYIDLLLFSYCGRTHISIRREAKKYKDTKPCFGFVGMILPIALTICQRTLAWHTLILALHPCILDQRRRVNGNRGWANSKTCTGSHALSHFF